MVKDSSYILSLKIGLLVYIDKMVEYAIIYTETNVPPNIYRTMATRHIEMQKAVNLCIHDDLLSINNREEMEKKLLNGEDTGLQYWELRMFYKELEHVYDAEFYEDDEHANEVLEENALVDEVERDLSQRPSLGIDFTIEELDRVLATAPCSFCLGEHHPAADCPADEEVRRFNESQEHPRDLDMYHSDDFH